MKIISYTIIILSVFIASSLYAVDIPEAKGGLREPKLFIKNWSPTTSLTTHYGHGNKIENEPLLSFNLNLGYFRFFMKGDTNEDKTYVYNWRFTWILEIKPMDFASFLASGSSFSLFMEKNEWLRNITFIMSSKTFSSTQFITGDLLWYFDFLNNALDIRSVIIPQSQTSKSALESFYPATRRVSFGLSDRAHIIQTPTWALGVVGYFEFHIPEGKVQVAKGPGAGALSNFFSSSFTYGGLGGVFFRYKKNSMEINTGLMYQLMGGDFDAWVITVTQNTISIPFEISFVDQYFFHARYYFINWKNEEFKETFDSHTLNLGGEVKGFGKGFYWIGSGLDIFYQAMGQKRGYTYDSSLNAFGFAIPLNWYPLAFHGKNHNLKISFIYGLFKYSSKKNLFSGGVLETGSGTNSSIMFRVSYTF